MQKQIILAYCDNETLQVELIRTSDKQKWFDTSISGYCDYIVNILPNNVIRKVKTKLVASKNGWLSIEYAFRYNKKRYTYYVCVG